MQEKKNPVQVLIENKKAVLDAYQTGGGPKKAWDVLTGEVPEIADAMSFNSFKVYLVPFVLIAAEYDKQLEAVTQKLHNHKARETGRKESDDIVAQELHNSEGTNFSGWTVHQGKDGYFRMHRRFGGRLHSIYVGKVFDRDKARQKIDAKEKCWLRPNSDPLSAGNRTHPTG